MFFLIIWMNQTCPILGEIVMTVSVNTTSHINLNVLLLQHKQATLHIHGFIANSQTEY